MAILFFENKTGRHDWTPEEVATWLLDNGHVVPPQPPTALELLTRRIAKSASAARTKDAGAAVEHRLHVAYRAIVNGEEQMRWVTMDGPALTPEMLNSSASRRKDQAVNILACIAADIAHARLRHPDWEIRALDPNLTDELTWRLNAPPDEGEARKAG